MASQDAARLAADREEFRVHSLQKAKLLDKVSHRIAAGKAARSEVVEAEGFVDESDRRDAGDAEVEHPLLGVGAPFGKADGQTKEVASHETGNRGDEIVAEQVWKEGVVAAEEAGGHFPAGNAACVRRLGVEDAGVVNALKIDVGAVGVHEAEFRTTLEEFKLTIQFSGEKLVVGIQKGEESAAGAVNAAVAGRAASRVLLTDRAEAVAKFAFIALHDCGSVVGGAVVDENDLPIGECLGLNGFDGAGQKRRAVVGRDDDGHGGRGHTWGFIGQARRRVAWGENGRNPFAVKPAITGVGAIALVSHTAFHARKSPERRMVGRCFKAAFGNGKPRNSRTLAVQDGNLVLQQPIGYIIGTGEVAGDDLAMQPCGDEPVIIAEV